MKETAQLPPDKDKIFEIFKRYNFQDEYGHPLLLCAEFIQLVNSYYEKSPTKKVVNHGLA